MLHRKKPKQRAKEASIHDFIMTLPNEYETQGSERQRIGLTRVFLHDALFVLLDEATSNLDNLNEAVILKSLKEESAISDTWTDLSGTRHSWRISAGSADCAVLYGNSVLLFTEFTETA